jgi:membrane peptidoglycan carboxypeptidase
MRRVLGILGWAAGLPLLWLFAVWPPPAWYRTHWPAETAFMAMRHSSREVGQREGGSARKQPRRKRWVWQELSRDAADQPLRLYHPVPLDSIAPAVAQAVLIGEDNNFPRHHGIDYQAILDALGYQGPEFEWTSSRDRRELIRVLPSLWTRRQAIRGASTITQQLAKNLYLSPSRNPLRKLKEAVTAYRIECALSKNRILELYLNVVELGGDVWGVEVASQTYFGRPASRLRRDQAAALAGTLPFPLRSNPGFRPGRMRWRQNLILRRMQGEAIDIPTPVEDLEPAIADTAATEDTTTAPAADTSAALMDTTLAPTVQDSSTR